MSEDELARAAEEARFTHPTSLRHPSASAQADSPYSKGVRMTIGVAVAGVVLLTIVWAATRPKAKRPSAGSTSARTATAPAVPIVSEDASVSPPAPVAPTPPAGARTFGTPVDAIALNLTVVDNDHVRVVIQNRDWRAILGIELVMVAPADPNGNVGSVSIPGLAASQKMDVVVPVDSIGQRLPVGPVELVKITGAHFASPQ